MAARALRAHLGRLPGCDRTSDFTIHDTEDGTSLLAGWVTEQLKAAAARNGARPDAKLVSFVTCTGPSPWHFKAIQKDLGNVQLPCATAPAPTPRWCVMPYKP